MPETLTQCRMRRILSGAYGVDVAWIETGLAKKGNRLTFRDLPGIYEVLEVWGTRLKKEVEDLERLYLEQRKASDIKRDPGRGHMEF